MKGTKLADVMTASVVAVREDAGVLIGEFALSLLATIRYVEGVVGVRDRLSYPEEDS
jgi:hypothetical protein